jgi:hypothetical protein
MAFTGLRPVEARKAENPPAATPVQRFVMPFFATQGMICNNGTSFFNTTNCFDQSQVRVSFCSHRH